MRRNTLLPVLAIFAIVFAVAAAAFVASRVRGGGAGGSSASLQMAERLLREDPTTGIELSPGVVVPALDQIVNSGITNPNDRMTLPIHPNARLIGSTHLNGGAGGNLVLVMYEVDEDMTTVAEAVAKQLDQSPWQVIGTNGQATQRVVGFQNTRVVDMQGSVTVRLYPKADSFDLTVSRGGKDATLPVKVTALVPSVGAATQDDLTVLRVEPGSAQSAGLLKGDRIVRVNDTAVKNPQELAAALRQVVAGGTPRSALTYLIAQDPPQDQEQGRQAFIAPEPPIALPAAFPAAQAWQGLTVVNYSAGQIEGGRAYQASFVSKDAASAVANRVRDGLKAAGWQITADTPQGFATHLEIAHSGDGLLGQVAIDQFPEDSAYILVQVQIQSGQPAGRP